MYEGMIAETVGFRGHNDDLIEGYLARPLGAGPFPGVVLIHHLPGWDEATKEITRKLAYHGYVGFAPHLHHREGPGTPEEIMAKIWQAGWIPDEQCIGDVDAAIRYLETLALLQREGGNYRLLFRRPAGLSDGLQDQTHQCRRGLLWGTGGGQTRGTVPSVSRLPPLT